MSEEELHLGVGEVDTVSTRTEQLLLAGHEQPSYETNSEDRRSTIVEEPSNPDTTCNSPTSSARVEPTDTANLIKTNENLEAAAKIEIVTVELPNGTKGRLKRSNSRIETDLASLSFLEKPKVNIEEPKETELAEEEEPTEEKLETNSEKQQPIDEKTIKKIQSMKPSELKEKTSDHIIFVNDRARTKKQWWFWPSNYIRTTRYTPLTFIPQNLFEQLRRVSNIYFILTMIITLIPGVSPVFPITSILPVIFILSLTMIKDGLEDLVRYFDDYKINNVKYHVIRNGKMVSIPSKKIELGDIVVVKRNDEIPADLLLISCSNEEGISFVETANLDGETNLKPRKCLLKSSEYKNPEDFEKLKSIITVEPPNEYLNNFQGQYIISEDSTNIIPLNSDNLLLRGCVLRNTKIAYGIATYVGKNTKMFKNLKKPRSKFSALDKKLNLVLFVLLIAQQLGCILSVVFSSYFQNNVTLNSFYVSRYNPNQVDYTYVASDWLTYFVLYNLVIPMSLFVGLEFVKSFQAKVMEFDPHMMEDGVGMKAKTSNLNEELSQLDFIFSDKTGTLTENVMEFKKAFIHGIEYDKMKKSNLLEDVVTTSKVKSEVETVHLFLLNLATNHAVIPEFVDESISYDGPSPDEIALLDCAQLNGYVLTQKTNSGVEVSILGLKIFFEILAVIDFTSSRKMMTVVVRTSDNKIILFSKGADNVMIERLSIENSKEANQLVECQEKLYEYSVEGLRTLVICYRELSEEYFEDWRGRYQKASSSLKSRKKDMEVLEKELEVDFKLLGCTAIEDKLQPGVPEAIEYLIKMKLQVWVLTGDKTETAINISQCANVIKRDSTLKLIISGDTPQKVEHELMCILQFLKNEKKKKIKDKLYAVVVSGKSLDYILASNTKSFQNQVLSVLNLNKTKLQSLFTEISSYCYSAVCSRLLPIQKALLVKLILKFNKKKGLSIGDGANDVSMIQSASVGVGVMGREGSQAARAADYAIPKFRHLIRLVAIHGRYSYVRNSDYLHISFYKNLLVVFGQFFFSIFCAFTGQTFYDSWTITFYNTFFTTFFPFVPAIFEKDLKEKVIFDNPSIYKSVANEKLFNLGTVLLTILTSLYHSTAIFFIIWGIDYTSGGMLELPYNDGIWTTGAVNMTATFFVIVIRVLLETRSITFIHYALHFSSIMVYFIFHYFYSCFVLIDIPGAPANGFFFYETFVILKSLKIWMIIIICISIAILPDFCIKFVRKRFFPDPATKLRTLDADEKNKNQWFNLSCDDNVEEKPNTIF